MLGKSGRLAKGHKFVLYLLTVLLCLSAPTLAAGKVPFVGYRDLQVAGWDVRIQRRLERRNFIVAERAEAVLRKQLAEIEASVPAWRLAQMRGVTIWLSYDNEPGLAYHHDLEWLRRAGRDLAMVNGIEIEDARDFLTMAAQQPWLLLHELTHALHHQQHDWRIAAVDEAWLAAKRSEALYRGVAHRFAGPARDAYALTNPREYLAELSEAFFGSNAMYPFDAGELQRYDPAGFAAVHAFWCQPPVSEAPLDAVGPCDVVFNQP